MDHEELLDRSHGRCFDSFSEARHGTAAPRTGPGHSCPDADRTHSSTGLSVGWEQSAQNANEEARYVLENGHVNV
jgi:hypothetical protein